MPWSLGRLQSLRREKETNEAEIAETATSESGAGSGAPPEPDNTPHPDE